jgi:hypothetical protein
MMQCRPAVALQSAAEHEAYVSNHSQPRPQLYAILG